MPGSSDARERLARRLDERYWPGYSDQSSAERQAAAPGNGDSPTGHDPDPKHEGGDPRASRDLGTGERDAEDDSLRSTDDRSEQADPFASYPPDLRAYMHHDDTLARLQYVNASTEDPITTSQTPDAAAPADASNHGSSSGTRDDPGPEATLADDRVPPSPPSADEQAVQPDVPQNQSGDDRSSAPLGQAVDQVDRQPTGEAATDTTSVTNVADSPQPSAASRVTELVIERDESWDTTRAALPPGALPESAKTLSPEVVGALDPDVRRVLEYQGASEYIATHKEDRPWLEPAADASPPVQRIFTAIDQGNGHAHIRHGPMGGDQLYADRVARLEDPAQTDPELRAKSVDGLIPNVVHYCAQESTRIGDVEAFVAAFAGAIKHSEVRRTLDSQWISKDVPDQVEIPISELLGPDGHETCSGYRLAGEWPDAKKARKLWVKARADGQDLSGIPQPTAEPIPTFEGGDIIVVFANNSAEQRYEIGSLYPRPRAQKAPES